MNWVVYFFLPFLCNLGGIYLALLQIILFQIISIFVINESSFFTFILILFTVMFNSNS